MTIEQNKTALPTRTELLQIDMQIHAKQVEKSLNEAIATMRSFLDQAANAAQMCHEDPARAVERVMHQFAWGSANASSSLETAMIEARKYDKSATALEVIR